MFRGLFHTALNGFAAIVTGRMASKNGASLRIRKPEVYSGGAYKYVDRSRLLPAGPV